MTREIKKGIQMAVPRAMEKTDGGVPRKPSWT
jgi:hypothetical protein